MIVTVKYFYVVSHGNIHHQTVAQIFVCQISGTKIEQSFTVSVFIGGIKGEDQSILQSENPKLDGLTHNRTRLLSCKQVGWSLKSYLLYTPLQQRFILGSD